MGATIQKEDGNVRVLRITGILKKSELDSVLEREEREWGPATRIKVLAILEDFEGWERGADWGDMTFFVSHDHQVEKIAVVADPRWEAGVLMFAGAGVRRGPVKFFPSSQLAQARAWLG